MVFCKVKAICDLGESLVFHLFLAMLGLLCGSEGKESASNVGDPDSIPELGRSPGEGNGNPLQYSCLENPMDGGAWRATVYGVLIAEHGLSLAMASGGYSRVGVLGVSCWGAPALGHVAFSSCNMWTQSLQLLAPRAQDQLLWCTGLVAPQHVGSSQARD